MPTNLRRLLALSLLLCGLALLGLSLATESPQGESRVLTLRLDGAIGPASSDYFSRALTKAVEQSANVIVIEMDTPGGLDTSMRAIIKDILASPIPVVTYVSPEGARAASAGTFILYASHVAAMAPATNLGAASPVAIGAPGGSPAREGAQDRRGAEAEERDAGSATEDAASEDEKPARQRGSGPSTGSTAMDKATSDAAAYIRGLAQLRGRDIDFAERAVREAASLSSSEALEAGVIDLIARNLSDLLDQIDGREVTLDSGDVVVLATAGASIERLEPDWRHQFLAVISNPQIALVLMMIGIYGLFFEFTSPGFGVPGVAGLICLLIAMYSFQLLPVNWAGVALMAVGAILMLAEAFMPSFGVLGIGGVIAFIMGGLFLFDGEAPGFELPLSFLITMGLISAALLFALGTFAVRARKRRVVSGSEQMTGTVGTVTSIDAHGTYAHIRGESWKVSAETPLSPGDEVRVMALDGLTLKVKRIDTNEPTTTRSTA